MISLIIILKLLIKIFQISNFLRITNFYYSLEISHIKNIVMNIINERFRLIILRLINIIIFRNI